LAGRADGPAAGRTGRDGGIVAGEGRGLRKRLVIAGHSREGLELAPLLEANPAVEVCAIVADDPAAALAVLESIDPASAQRLALRITDDVERALALPGLSAVIDADAPPPLRERLAAARGVPVTTPALARMLYAFGPADAFSKPDLLAALREIMDSADLTRDRRSVLDLVLQVAVTATGADRGSLMLWDEHERVLRVAVALGIEEELIAKIRVRAGEGIAGRAFAVERAVLLHGKADHTRWQIVRERDDVESAISAPLVHQGRVLGVLNLSHARHQNQFTEEDLAFVEELARLDARIIARAEELHGILRESASLRVESQLRRVLSRAEPLPARLTAACALLADGLRGGTARLWLAEPVEAAQGSAPGAQPGLALQASSTRVDPLGGRERLAPGQGLPGRAAVERRGLWLAGRAPDTDLCSAALPLLAGDELLGALEVGGAVDLRGELPDRLAAAAAALAEELAGQLRTARLERDARRNDRLGGAAAALAACEDARTLWDLVTASALSLLEAQDAVLRLRDPESGRFRIVSWSGIGQWRRAPLAELERRLATEAMRARKLVRVADLSSDPAFAEHAVGVATAMIAPLLRDGQPAGSLSVLGKVPEEPLLGDRFGPADEAVLERLAQHVHAALGAFREPERPDLDPATGLPTARLLRERLDEELARSHFRGHRMVLLELRAAGLAPEARPGPAAERVAAALARALRAALRPFDVLARTAPERFVALVPEPEQEPAALLADLARRAREVLAGHAAPVQLQIGFAVFPDDAVDADGLEARAAESRPQAL
jgi:GAF domain-containing protein